MCTYKECEKAICAVVRNYNYGHPIYNLLRQWAKRIETEWCGKRGISERREAIRKAALRVGKEPRLQRLTQSQRIALGLAKKAGMYFDEHGSYRRGDYLSTVALHAVPSKHSTKGPYHDSGNAGLGLVSVCRKRVYARSSKWYPQHTTTKYLVGRNESGTFFAHAVPASASTVDAALDWIWSGHAQNIVRRQGDIALIKGAGPKLPVLPAGHRVEGSYIVHATHPPIELPGKGERVIVGRRAFVRVSNETRD